jgi:hypothetical protein
MTSATVKVSYCGFISLHFEGKYDCNIYQANELTVTSRPHLFPHSQSRVKVADDS